jgi:hypothetical protein
MFLKLRVFNILILFLTTAFSSLAYSYIDSVETGSVVVEEPQDFTASYKNRRSKHGFVLAFHSESFYPLDYQSMFGDVYIEDIAGSEAIKLTGLELGYKYNISIGSVAGLYNYSQGSVGNTRTITLSRQALAANIALDGILEEPWVVPYFQFGVHQFSASEDNGTTSESAVTGVSFNYRYGLQFQIDWLEALMDSSAKADRLRSSGLENTFIDVYYVDHLPSGAAQDPTVLGSEGEPNLLSSGEMGIGLRLEF